jgi:hypothetical protein
MRFIFAVLSVFAISASLVADEIRGKVVSITARAAKIGLWADPPRCRLGSIARNRR